MFKIGEFSRLSQVPMATLRFYDEVGLLKPKAVDRFTGYRYYAADQLGPLNRILALKDLGLSLEQIAQLLAADVPAAQLREMLRIKRQELGRRVRDEQARLARVETRLRQIELEDTMAPHEVVLKQVDPITVAMVRTVVPAHRNVDRLFDEVFAYLRQHTVPYAEQPIAIWHDRPPMLEVNAAVPIATSGEGNAWANGRVTVEVLPAVATMATVVHDEQNGAFGHAYEALADWIGAQGYVLCGPYRELLRIGTSADDRRSTTIELQAPVERDTRVDTVRSILAPAELGLLSERSKQVLGHAADEARRRGRFVPGEEEILVGLIGVGEGFAGYVLNSFGVTLEAVRSGISAPARDEQVLSLEGDKPLRHVLGGALEEVQHRGQDYIGTEHLLLGLLSDRMGSAARLLEDLGVAPDHVNSEVEQLMEQA